MTSCDVRRVQNFAYIQQPCRDETGRDLSDRSDVVAVAVSVASSLCRLFLAPICKISYNFDSQDSISEPCSTAQAALPCPPWPLPLVSCNFNARCSSRGCVLDTALEVIPPGTCWIHVAVLRKSLYLQLSIHLLGLGICKENFHIC